MKKIDPAVLIDWWLKKYHNTTMDEILDKNPEWKRISDEYRKVMYNEIAPDSPEGQRILDERNVAQRAFYKKYAVTQEQHDEWEDWAKKYARKITKLPKKLFDRSWSFTYLNVSPMTKK